MLTQVLFYHMNNLMICHDTIKVYSNTNYFMECQICAKILEVNKWMKFLVEQVTISN